MKIRKIKDVDLEWVTRSIEKEKWGYLISDVKTCFDLDPNGCFIAEYHAQRVGHAFSVTYNHFSWISLVIVDKKYRKLGIASALMEKILSDLDRHGPGAVYLEAVPEIADLYRKFGFKDQFDSLRYLNTSITSQNFTTTGIRQVQHNDLEELIDFDSQYFGSHRAGVIHRFLKDYPGYCFLKKRNHKITGFVMARKTSKGYWIGPLTCNPDYSKDAWPLIDTCVQALGALGDPIPEIRMGTPSINQSAVNLLSTLGFEKVGSSIRMVRGDEKDTCNLLGIFGIGGPEKG